LRQEKQNLKGNNMQPTNPLKSLKEGTLMAMATDMNSAQAVAAALIPRFGLEITVDGDQLQVNVAELNTGHDIRMAREVAAAVQEAMRQLVVKIDDFIEKNPNATTGGTTTTTVLPS
jgi:hypothetical protein